MDDIAYKNNRKSAIIGLMAKKRNEIRLTEEEQRKLLENARVVQTATIGPEGQPHLVPMWYALEDDAIVYTTYGKSQKVKNLERDPRITLLVEAGESYATLRGMSIESTAELGREPRNTARIMNMVASRYSREYIPDPEPDAELPPQAYKRIVIRVPLQGGRIRTWDHRKM